MIGYSLLTLSVRPRSDLPLHDSSKENPQNDLSMIENASRSYPQPARSDGVDVTTEDKGAEVLDSTHSNTYQDGEENTKDNVPSSLVIKLKYKPEPKSNSKSKSKPNSNSQSLPKTSQLPDKSMYDLEENSNGEWFNRWAHIDVVVRRMWDPKLAKEDEPAPIDSKSDPHSCVTNMSNRHRNALNVKYVSPR